MTRNSELENWFLTFTLGDDCFCIAIKLDFYFSNFVYFEFKRKHVGNSVNNSFYLLSLLVSYLFAVLETNNLGETFFYAWYYKVLQF